MAPSASVRGGSPPSIKVIRIPRLGHGGLTFGTFCVSIIFLTAAALMPVGPVMKALCAGYGLLIFLPVTSFLPRIFNRFHTIRVTDTGMQKDGQFIPWKAVREIRWGILHPLRIRIFYEAPKKPQWHKIDLFSLGRVGVLSISASRESFDELLPEILRRRKDLKVSASLMRVMCDPERLFRIPWIVSLRLFANIVLLLLIWLLIWRSSGPLLEVFFLALLATFCAMPVGELRLTPEQKFVCSAGRIPAFFQFIILGLVMEIPAFVLEALSVMGAAFMLSALLLAMFRIRLSLPVKAVIVVLSVFLSLVTYHAVIQRQLVKKDISGLMGNSWSSVPPSWSSTVDDKGFISKTMDEDQQKIILPDSNQTSPLPHHYGFECVRAFDKFSVVRAVLTQSPSKMTLFLYRRADDTEIKLASAYELRVRPQQCLSPNGKRLCYLEYASEDSDPILRVYDLDRREMTPCFELPKASNLRWVACWWMDDQTLAIQASEPSFENRFYRRLHVFKADYRRGITEHFMSPQFFEDWMVSPDLSYAFAKSGDNAIYYVNLLTGEQKDLGGGEFPEWIRGEDLALREKTLSDGGRWLCQFDPRTVTENPIYKIPADVKLQYVSPTGKFAVLVAEDVFQLRPLSLVKLSTGERYQLDVSVGARLILANLRFPFNPQATLWTPDESQFLLQSVDIKLDSLKKIKCDFKTYLYNLPDGW